MDYPTLFEFKYWMLSNGFIILICFFVGFILAAILGNIIVQKYRGVNKDIIIDLLGLSVIIMLVCSISVIFFADLPYERIPVYKEVQLSNTASVSDHLKSREKRIERIVCFADTESESIDDCIKANRPQKRTKQEIYEIWKKKSVFSREKNSH